MDPRLAELLADGDGVLHRSAALAAGPRHCLESALRAGELVRLAPQTYAAVTASDSWLAERVALTAAGPHAALSHNSALALWGVAARRWGPADEAGSVHLTVPHGVRRRSIPGAVVHQRRGFLGPASGSSRDAAAREGLAVVRLERAVVETWSVLPAGLARAPVIDAVRARLTTPARLREASVDLPRLRGRRELRALLDLLDEGCHSELEIWGYATVFADPRLPRSVAQHPVQLASGRTVYLDRAFLQAKVAVELDGERHHGSRSAREVDVRRDASLATLGWLTVRWTHRRMHAARSSLVDELVAVLGHRPSR